MTTGLKNTIIMSTALAGLLNFAHFAASYNQRAQATFSPTWLTPKPKAVNGISRATAETALPDVATPTEAATPGPGTDRVPITAAKLVSAGLRPDFAGSYLAVEAQTGTPWQLLAAVHRVESGQSGDTGSRSFAGATGPMQFMPATFAHYAQDGDGDGDADITDLDDAMLTAGRYLAAGGADKGRYNTALYNYNHSNSYVAQVLGIARRLGL